MPPRVSRRLARLLIAGLVLANLVVHAFPVYSLAQDGRRGEEAARHATRNGAAEVSTQALPQAGVADRHRAAAIVAAFALLSLVCGVAALRWLRQGDADLQALSEHRRFAMRILDSLTEHVAVIDERGVITAVNAAWRDFAAANGAAEEASVAVGANYLQACAGAPGPDEGDEAAQALAGIRDVLQGRRQDFSIEYPCHSPTEQRWFALHGMPLAGGQRGAVLIHQNVTYRHQAEALLRASEARYRLLAENISDVIWVLDLAARRFTYVSPSVQQLRGYAPDEVMAQPLDAALTPESAQRVGERMRQRMQAAAAGQRYEADDVTEVDQWHRDGRILHTEVSTRYLYDEQGRPHTVLGVSRDITQRKSQEAQLRASEEHFRLLAENMEDVVWKTSRELVFTYINDADRRLRGFPLAEVLGRPIDDTLTEHGKVLLALERGKRAEMEKRGEKGRARHVELQQRRADGGAVWVEVMSIPVYDTQGTIAGFQGICRDISQRKALQAELEQSRQALELQLQAIASQHRELRDQVHRDPLTGAHNRRYLDEALPRELARAEAGCYPVAVIMVDLDHFKQVNDRHSHAAGDRVLKALTTLLTEGARDSDIVCRYGGEEFVLVIPRLSPELARQRMDALRCKLQDQRTVHGGAEIAITFSAGVAVHPEHGATGEILIARADEMLYRAKREGRNRVSVYGSEAGPAA